jgi:SRSO17 transposase
MRKEEPVVAWIVDDTGFPKKGKESVGVTNQYRGQLGKQENCRVAVSLSVSTWTLSLPVSYRLYLPENWANDFARRNKAGIPAEIQFQTKPCIALEQVRQAVVAGIPRGVVLSDAAYGVDSQFRAGLRELGLEYAVGVQSSVSVWEPGRQDTPAGPAETKDRAATETVAPR